MDSCYISGKHAIILVGQSLAALSRRTPSPVLCSGVFLLSSTSKKNPQRSLSEISDADSPRELHSIRKRVTNHLYAGTITMIRPILRLEGALEAP
jgi:hypothetical protein